MADKKTVWLGWTAGVEERSGERVGWIAHVFRLKNYIYIFFFGFGQYGREVFIAAYLKEAGGSQPFHFGCESCLGSC